jgi:hypothetical protein
MGQLRESGTLSPAPRRACCPELASDSRGRPSQLEGRTQCATVTGSAEHCAGAGTAGRVGLWRWRHLNKYSGSAFRLR